MCNVREIKVLNIHKFVMCNIYHLVTPRFNEGIGIYPQLVSIFFSKHHIYNV